MILVSLDSVTIVLHKPRYPENIGSAARAAKNMGITRLVAVSPESFDIERIKRLATHAACDVVDGIRIFESLKEALKPFGYVVGTTARLGGVRSDVISPEELGRRFPSISQNNETALVFGPEDRGLSNEDLRLCHALVNIPTADFASLNVAQAVMLVSYELFKAGLATKAKPVPRLAERHELDGMYDQVRDILVRIDYINHENPDYWMNRMRKFFTRLQLQAKEVSIIRGICRQINWYGGSERQKGRDEARAAGISNSALTNRQKTTKRTSMPKPGTWTK